MQALSAGPLVAVSSLREFFRDAFHTASELHLDIDEQAEQYVVNLLTMFSRRCLLRKDAGWAALSAGAHASGCVGSAERRCPAARSATAGRCSLFIAGFFARSFARKLIDIDYHIAMGGNAYSSLAIPCSARCRDAAWRGSMLNCAEISGLVDALNEVSDMSYRHTDADILRLYEIWMKTGSPRAGGLLRRWAVQPVTAAGARREH